MEEGPRTKADRLPTTGKVAMLENMQNLQVSFLLALRGFACSSLARASLLQVGAREALLHLFLRPFHRLHSYQLV